MRYKVGVTIQVELETEASTEQDAIIIAMDKTEQAVDGMKIRKHWWEYVKEIKQNGRADNDDRTDERPRSVVETSQQRVRR